MPIDNRGTQSRPAMTAAMIGALFAGVVAAGCATRAPAAQPGAEARALDPLTAMERATAEKLARADRRAVELLGDAARLASIELLALKGAGADEVARHADLLFARPAGDYGVRAIVRLGADSSVTDVSRVAATSVPMTQDDVDQAWAIARADTAYAAKLGADPSRLRVEALRIYTEDRDDPCASGRCFYLIVRDGAFYVSGASVIVDLATRRLLPVRR